MLATFGLISVIENSILVYRQFINDELTFISRTKAPFEWHLIFKWAPLEGQTEVINTLPTEKIPSVSSSSSAGSAVKPVPTSLPPGTATLFNTSSDRTPHSTTQTLTEVSTTVSSSDGRTVNPKVGVTTDLLILNSSDHKTVKPASKLAKTNVTTVIDTNSTIGVTTSVSPTEATTPEPTKTPTKPSPLTVSTPAKHSNTATQTTTAFPLIPSSSVSNNGSKTSTEVCDKKMQPILHSYNISSINVVAEIELTFTERFKVCKPDYLSR